MSKLPDPRAVLRRARDAYGANPLQLLVLTACFALSAYAFYRASLGPLPMRMLVWFIAAVVGHDLVLFPLYALADRSWHAFAHRPRTLRRRERTLPAVPVINYLRVPVVLAGMLLIAFWGTITGQGDDSFRYASDHSYVDYGLRFLVVVGVLFAVSAVLYAWRLGKVRSAARPSRATAEPVAE